MRMGTHMPEQGFPEVVDFDCFTRNVACMYGIGAVTQDLCSTLNKEGVPILKDSCREKASSYCVIHSPAQIMFKILRLQEGGALPLQER